MHSHLVTFIYFVRYLKRQDEEIKLIIQKLQKFKFIGLVNASFATFKEEQKSIFGKINTLRGSNISWTSKQQERNALSLIKAKYYLVLLKKTKLSFICKILIKIGQTQEPGYIIGDNTGAIQLVKNQQVDH